jgi:hypothetical protein
MRESRKKEGERRRKRKEKKRKNGKFSKLENFQKNKR